jgi:hypothetical protein
LKRIAASIVAAAMLAAAPAMADQLSRADPVRDGFLTIGGPETLTPSANLRIPIRCSVECRTTAKTMLVTPTDVIGPDTARGHLTPGHPRKLIVTLNDAATQDITDNYSTSWLRVGVRAVSSSSGAKAHAVKIFKFTPAGP